jgi:hypothetical protein
VVSPNEIIANGKFRHLRLEATLVILAAVNHRQQYFAPLIELSKDNGLIGQVLKHYPAEILRAADKWAEQNREYQEKHRDPNRMPLPDPWQFLLDIRTLTKKDKEVFRAAQSQNGALRHLFHMAQGIATLNTDWFQKALESYAKGNKIGFKHAIRKVTDAHVTHVRVHDDVRSQNDPELLAQMEHIWKKRRAQLVHRGEKLRQPKRWPTWAEFRNKNKLPVILAEWWVRCGTNSVPGLMFWRNEALTKFLKVHLDQANLDSRTVKKIRQQLGLVPVGDHDHFVWDIIIKSGPDGCEMKGLHRNGAQYFRAVIDPRKRVSASVLRSLK